MTNFLASIPLAPEILNQAHPDVIAVLLAQQEKILSLGAHAQKLEAHALKLEAHALKLEAHAQKLEAQVQELLAKFNQNSFNSNTPHSSDSPFRAKPDAPKKNQKKRKRNR